VHAVVSATIKHIDAVNLSDGETSLSSGRVSNEAVMQRLHFLQEGGWESKREKAREKERYRGCERERAAYLSLIDLLYRAYLPGTSF
jgi:hypothetical protein